MRGEEISVKKIAEAYGVSTKSVSRDIAKVKAFLAENREMTKHAELVYDYSAKAYRLTSDEFLSDKEMFAVAKIILGTRALSGMDAAGLIEKIKKFTTIKDRRMLDEIVRKELYHYTEIKHDCNNLIENVWRLIKILHDKREITIRYNKINRSVSEVRIQPASLVFMEYYFYLIAYYPDQYEEPRYFRIDRIKNIVEHRVRFDAHIIPDFDEGLLRKRCQFMFYGKLRRVRFLFSGLSVQAILDRLPTAKIIERKKGAYILEAEAHCDGIKMFLLSQGAWVKVLGPPEFAEEMAAEIEKMKKLYGE